MPADEAAKYKGSSPRVRGTCSQNGLSSIRYGLIPAGAGNIHAEAVSFVPFRAHPRGCGEHAFRKGYGKVGQGSSPRVRGTW